MMGEDLSRDDIPQAPGLDTTGRTHLPALNSRHSYGSIYVNGRPLRYNKWHVFAASRHESDDLRRWQGRSARKRSVYVMDKRGGF